MHSIHHLLPLDLWPRHIYIRHRSQFMLLKLQRGHQLDTLVLELHRQLLIFLRGNRDSFAQLGMPMSQALWKLIDGGLLMPLSARPLPQVILPHFRMDLCCAYHQSQGHDIDRCVTLRHAIQDMIDQGLVQLG